MEHDENFKIDNDFAKILSKFVEWNGYFPDGIIAIDGVAVYLHSISLKNSLFIEASHDGDFYISQIDFVEFKDLQEVQKNDRLSKFQTIHDDLEYDIYVENQNKLAIPYAELLNNSQVIENIKVASLEDLLVLKLFAAIDRKNSAKGKKDIRDLIKIVYLEPKYINDFFIDKEKLEFLKNALNNKESYDFITKNNFHFSKQIKDKVLANFSKMEALSEKTSNKIKKKNYKEYEK